LHIKIDFSLNSVNCSIIAISLISSNSGLIVSISVSAKSQHLDWLYFLLEFYMQFKKIKVYFLCNRS